MPAVCNVKVNWNCYSENTPGLCNQHKIIPSYSEKAYSFLINFILFFSKLQDKNLKHCNNGCILWTIFVEGGSISRLMSYWRRNPVNHILWRKFPFTIKTKSCVSEAKYLIKVTLITWFVIFIFIYFKEMLFTYWYIHFLLTYLFFWRMHLFQTVNSQRNKSLKLKEEANFIILYLSTLLSI